MKKRIASVRVRRLADQTDDDDLRMLQPAERLQMMWPLALDAWAFKGEPVIEPRLPRHIVSVQRPKR